MIDLDDWDYDLPPERIARRPVAVRDRSRLMVVRVGGGRPEHRRFGDLPHLLAAGDLLVVNDTRVMAARLHGRRATGGAVELLVLEPGPGVVRALARPARRLVAGERLTLDGGGSAVIEVAGGGGAVVRVSFDRDPREVMAAQGAMPLPPYLRRDADDADVERYQTVYAGPLGAAAAPTAGLHFTGDLLERVRAAGVEVAALTLHVGIGTFRPVRPEDLEAGTLHSEPYVVGEDVAAAIRAARARGGRVIAVGTTSTRALEAATPPGARVPEPGARDTDLFIHPPYRFRAIDGLVTNFHLPRSSLLMLVAALVGRQRLLDAYAEAVEQGYRFYSYGDAMLLL